MAHFAQLDENNLVIQVIVIHNNELLDTEGKENEELGVAFCQSLFGANTVWKQTSYNNNFRKTFAFLGCKYDSICDAFIAPQPFNSWIFNETTLNWEPPVPMPINEKFYSWNEEQLAWIEKI